MYSLLFIEFYPSLPKILISRLIIHLKIFRLLLRQTDSNNKQIISLEYSWSNFIHIMPYRRGVWCRIFVQKVPFLSMYKKPDEWTTWLLNFFQTREAWLIVHLVDALFPPERLCVYHRSDSSHHYRFQFEKLKRSFSDKETRLEFVIFRHIHWNCFLIRVIHCRYEKNDYVFS